ncbi:cation diffusion facilitator family transporter [Ramlibacter aurantiacus]|uniref:cation diffusion facilitator family transporter n=1 Tax=Ramlibacter aurantiacus TaxID=2801330 RepID=UPI003F491C30
MKAAFALNLSFTIIEVIGGLWTNSIAILSDAVHDLGDSMSLGAALYFDRRSRRGRTPRDTYGMRRYSLLGGLITAAVLVVGLSFVLWHAVSRLFAPEPVNAPGMMVLAVVGVLFNGAAVLRVRRGTSLTERVVSWHLLEDTMGWVAVLLGAAAMSIWDLPIIDPLLSIGIALFVLWNVFRTLRQFLSVFLQHTPPGFEIDRFEQDVRSIPAVSSVQHTHGWSIDGESHVLTTHLVMNPGVDRQEIVAAKAAVRRLLGAKAFEHVTIEIELAGEEPEGGGHRGTRVSGAEG